MSQEWYLGSCMHLSGEEQLDPAFSLRSCAGGPCSQLLKYSHLGVADLVSMRAISAHQGMWHLDKLHASMHEEALALEPTVCLHLLKAS